MHLSKNVVYERTHLSLFDKQIAFTKEEFEILYSTILFMFFINHLEKEDYWVITRNKCRVVADRKQRHTRACARGLWRDRQVRALNDCRRRGRRRRRSRPPTGRADRAEWGGRSSEALTRRPKRRTRPIRNAAVARAKWRATRWERPAEMEDSAPRVHSSQTEAVRHRVHQWRPRDKDHKQNFNEVKPKWKENEWVQSLIRWQKINRANAMERITAN